jgi:hypothetical protein
MDPQQDSATMPGQDHQMEPPNTQETITDVIATLTNSGAPSITHIELLKKSAVWKNIMIMKNYPQSFIKSKVTIVTTILGLVAMLTTAVVTNYDTLKPTSKEITNLVQVEKSICVVQSECPKHHIKFQDIASKHPQWVSHLDALRGIMTDVCGELETMEEVKECSYDKSTPREIMMKSTTCQDVGQLLILVPQSHMDDLLDYLKRFDNRTIHPI